MEDIEKRKYEHVINSLKQESQYRISNWLEYVTLINNSLPEIDYNKIDTKAKLFDRTFNYPIYISGMTGGYQEAERINSRLAELAYKYNIPMGLGSIRAMLKNPSLKYTYNVKRGKDIFLIANIGGVQLKEYNINEIAEAIDSIEADAIAIHLNPTQELIQREGDLNWEGVREKIVELADRYKVIVKEVGAGLSRDVIEQLKYSKVWYYDVAGAGGTSWTRIEYMRNPEAVPGFQDWGIPTALALLMNKDYRLLASGGIRDGIEGFKCLVLGAEMFGMARPFLEAVIKEDLHVIDVVVSQLKGAMFLTGIDRLDKIKNVRYILLDPLRYAYEQVRADIFKG